jgi:hypothetical protein
VNEQPKFPRSAANVLSRGERDNRPRTRAIEGLVTASGVLWSRIGCDWLMRMFKKDEPPLPEEVFTPARPAGPEMWAAREFSGTDSPDGLQARFLSRLVEPGRQIVLYGDTGVGKTSLVEHVCSTNDIDLIRVECGPPFPEMLQEALAMGGFTQDTFEGRTTHEGSAGVRGDVAVAYSNSSRKDENTETSRSYPTSLATTVRVEFSRAAIKVLFLDNFENIRTKPYSGDLATDVAQLLKSSADHGELKVIVAGIPAESERLLLLDDATARRTAEIEVPRMTDEELDEVLKNGEKLLDLTFDSDCRATIIRYSDGFPYYTHLLALHASRAAIADGSKFVTANHFSEALGEVLEDADLSLKRAYANAVETSGSVKVRRSIMQAMASQERTELTFDEIRTPFQQIHPQYLTVASLNGVINPGLSALVDKHQVLQSRGKKKSIARTYRFANPLMRSYILLKAVREDSGDQLSM